MAFIHNNITIYASASLLLLFYTHAFVASANPENVENRWRPNGDNERGNETENQTNGIPNSWVANLFYDVLWNFTVSKGVGSSACQRQTQMYIRHLENNSLWAVQMSDSWSRYPNGMLVGTTHQMGIYDECIEVHRPVQGKYCLPQIILNPANRVNNKSRNRNELQSNDHAWSKIVEFIDDDQHIRRNYIKFGICIPESCTASDLEISLQYEFGKRFDPHQVNAQVKVNSMLCSTGNDMYPYDTGYYFTCILIGMILLTCCLSTAYHLIILIQSNKKEKTYKMSEVLRSFSMIRNIRDLIKYNKDNSLNVFNGVKVLTMIFVLFGHTFLYFVSNPMIYGKLIERLYIFRPGLLLTSMNLVDPFFYVSGFLMYFMLIPQFKKSTTSWYHIPSIIIYKYLRILPSYIIMILLTAFIIPHLGDGPLWNLRMWPEADKCRNYWWANLLVVNNFITIDKQCLIVSWYISCLLQFIAIGTIVIYVCAKNRKIGIFLIASLLCASMILPFVMTYIHRVYGMIMLMFSFFENIQNSEEFQNFYRPFYLRGTPFFAGLLAGVFVEDLKKPAKKISQLNVYVATFVVTIVCVIVQLYGVLFYDLSRPYSVLEQSFYASFSHCTWTTICFWCTLCHFRFGYGPIEKLFNNRFIIPLGRLSYTVYLVNITVILMIEGRKRISIYPSIEVVIDSWILGTFRSYLLGILLYLTVDAPFGLLIKRIFEGKKHKNNDNTINTKTNMESTEQNVLTHL